MKEFQNWRNSKIFWASWWTLWILTNDKSMCWRLIWYLIPVNSCMARFTSSVTAVDSSQMERCNSTTLCPLVNPPEIFTLCPLVNPPEIFTLCIRVFLIKRALDNPVQNLSILQNVWNPFWNICWTSAWVFGSSNIVVSKNICVWWLCI